MKTNDDEDDDNQSAKKDTVTFSAVEAIGRIWPYQPASQERHFEYTSSLFIRHLNSSTWKTQKSLLQAATCFAERTVWKEACATWRNVKGELFAKHFIENFPIEVFSCIEHTTYSSVKLHGLKFFVALYSNAIDSNDFYDVIKVHQDRLLKILVTFNDSTNFEISTNAKELSKTISKLSVQK